MAKKAVKKAAKPAKAAAKPAKKMAVKDIAAKDAKAVKGGAVRRRML